MQETLIETIETPSQPTVAIYDASRKVAGDRWQVTLVIRMPIAVPASGSDLPSPIEQIRLRLGDTVTFEHKATRTFVSETEKNGLLSRMAEEFKKGTLPYLYHRDFQKKFILKRYREALEKDRIKQGFTQDG